MRGNYSDNTALPFYSDEKLRHSEQCGDSGLFVVPQSKGIPNFQLVSSDPDIVNAFVIGIVRDAQTNQSVQSLFSISKTKETIDQVEYTFISYSGTSNLSPGNYYLSIPILGGSSPYEIVSENWTVTCEELCWRIKWRNECNSISGQYEDGFYNEFYIDEIDFEKAITEKIFQETTDLAGVKKRSFVSSKKFANFNIPGNDFIFESLDQLSSFDIVELENLITGQVFSMSEIETSGDGDCFFTVNIRFLKNVITNSRCCGITSPFIDSCQTETNGGGTPPCDDYEVNVSSSGNELTFTETNAPDGAEVIQWLLGGQIIGNGSTITLGQYGTYTARVSRGNCTKSDSYLYQDPCATFSLEVSALGNTIAGSATGDDNIVIEIIDENLNVIGTGLPFVVSQQQGSGLYTIRAKGDNCEKQQVVSVDVSQGSCEHEVGILVDPETLLLTGTVTGCGSIESQFIEKEDQDGLLTVVSNTNTHIVSETAIYFFNAICNGCLIRTRRLVVKPEEKIKVEICDPIKLDIENGPFNVKIEGCVSTKECDPCECTPELGPCENCNPPELINCDGWTITWYDDSARTNVITMFADDQDETYYYSITQTGCDTINGEFFHDAPQAGTAPANNIQG